MPQKMTMEQWLREADRFPSMGAAERWRQQNGVEVEGLPPPKLSAQWTGGELPPVREQYVAQPQGALSAAVGGAEEDRDANLSTLAGADDGTLDFTKLNDPAFFQRMYQKQRAAAQQQEQSAKQMFEQARERLARRYAGPGQAEQLFALSRAMLAPRKVPGFRGFLGQVMGAFGDIEAAEREAAQTREDKLAELQAQYQQGAASRAAGQQRATLDLMRAYASMNKPEKTRTGFNPITGVLTDMDTGEPVKPPPPKVGEIRKGYRFIGGDPANPRSWQKVM